RDDESKRIAVLGINFAFASRRAGSKPASGDRAHRASQRDHRRRDAPRSFQSGGHARETPRRFLCGILFLASLTRLWLPTCAPIFGGKGVRTASILIYNCCTAQRLWPKLRTN